jgi:hypothetical protein
MKIKLHENRTVSIDMKDSLNRAFYSFSNNDETTKRIAFLTPATRYLFEVRDDVVSPL